MEKLYVVVRNDLPPGAQLSQAVHAAREFAAAHPELELAWFRGANNLAILQVPNEEAISALLARACAAGVPVAPCREPDMANELTALALADSARRLVSSLPLALREPRAA